MLSGAYNSPAIVLGDGAAAASVSEKAFAFPKPDNFEKRAPRPERFLVALTSCTNERKANQDGKIGKICTENLVRKMSSRVQSIIYTSGDKRIEKCGSIQIK